MSEKRDAKKKLNQVIDNAEPFKGKKKDTAPDDRGFYKPIDYLPEDAPVKALGRKGNVYYFLGVLGEFMEFKGSELGRLNIISLCGGEEWLIKTYPQYDKNGILKGWNHGALGGILMKACTAKGTWEPLERVRGAGSWIEDGKLITHCGDVLYIGCERASLGMRGKLLYPKSDRLREPVFGAKAGPDGPAARLLAMAETWNWARPGIDAKLWVGLFGCQRLGQANEWRAQAWITGGFSTGKSTLQRLLRWAHGKGGIIMAENATPAGIAQTVGYSSLPVSLDELEAKADSRQVNDVMELIRIASSGGVRLRGGQDGTPTLTQLWNCFMASSVLMTPLKSQDKSRMAVLSLRRLELQTREPGEDEAEEDLEEESDYDGVLGRRDTWDKTGAELSGRLIEQFPRYKRTFRSYRRALVSVGHGNRAADQFGAIGAAYDLMMWDGYDPTRAVEWGQMLPPSALDEVVDPQGEERQCLDHLLEYMPDIYKSGAKETVAHWLIEARAEIFSEQKGGAGAATLGKLGIRVYRDDISFRAAASARLEGDAKWQKLWRFFIDIGTSGSAIREAYKNTHWRGDAGTQGAWAQAMQRLPGAEFGENGTRRRRRIGDMQHTVTTLPWETVFPPMLDGEEDDIAVDDRTKA